jgi:ABC-2 type transport system permease protein
MRYLRILTCCWKNCLMRELGFRAHFLVKAASELLWVGAMLLFVQVIFTSTRQISGWTAEQYLFLMGTHMIITSVAEALFYGNCWRLSHLVRTGDLDFLLLRPVNPQFLISFERIDLSALANVPVGIGLCLYGTAGMDPPVSGVQIAAFGVLLVAGVAILYSLVFMFAISSVWLIRQTGLEHLWFYTVSLSRYPSEIYRHFLGGVFFFTLVFVIPVLLVANVPARTVVRALQPGWSAYMLIMGVVLVCLSHVAMNTALKWYRSASS